MSQLLNLKLVGSLTPCSRVVRVQNQVIGANVVIAVQKKSAAPVTVGGGAAFWPDQEFAIPALNKDDTVIAIQTMAGFADSPAATTTVQAPPSVADLSAGKFGQPLYVCAKCVYLYNMVPGAVVEVSNGFEPLGKEIVRSTGEAFVGLNRELKNSDSLIAVQACGGSTGALILGGSPVPPPNPLPAPTVQPAVECDRAITVTGVVNGAQVTVSRGGQKLDPVCSPTSTLFFLDIKPLQKPTDDPIQAVQAFPHDLCRLQSPAGTTPLLPKNKIGPPVLGMLCEGQVGFNVFNLRLGATVEVVVNGATILFGAGTTSVLVPASALAFPQTVTARQNTCGDPASWSPFAKSVVGSAKPVPPNLLSPANNATKVSVSPLLIFSPNGSFCNGPNSLDVQIATNSGFTTQLQKGTVGPGTTFWTPPAKLKFATGYFWRVRANKIGQPSSAWVTFKFTTAAKDQQPQPPGPLPKPQRFCFIEDCCPFYRRRIEVTATSLADAEAQARAKSPSNCSLTPVDCDAPQPPPCSQP